VARGSEVGGPLGASVVFNRSGCDSSSDSLEGFDLFRREGGGGGGASMTTDVGA
jgi:hypothetical protein